MRAVIDEDGKTSGLLGRRLLSFGGRSFSCCNLAHNFQVDSYGGAHFRMELSDNVVVAALAERFVKLQCAAIDFHTLSGQSLSDLLIGDGAECFALFAGLQFEVKLYACYLGSHLLEVGQLSRFTLRTLLLQHVDETPIGRRRLKGKPLRDQVVASVSGFHRHKVGFTAQTFYLRREDYFHVCHNSKNRVWWPPNTPFLKRCQAQILALLDIRRERVYDFWRMQTRVICIDATTNARSVYREVAELLASGQIAALPTETVYGLAADAFCEEAVARVFEVKERPSFDPLICHLTEAAAVHSIADVPAELYSLVNKLAELFWPGPMTLVLPRKACVPDIVTSGLPTVACRVTRHEVMRGVARALGRPVAAPSANRFGRISPTSAAAVLEELGGRIPLVVDAGACSEGLESTILQPCLDEKGKPAVRLLREGPITREKLRGVCRVLRAKHAATVAAPTAPGQLSSHYAPTKPMILCDPHAPFVPEQGTRYGLITYQGDSPLAAQGGWAQVMALSPGSGRLAEAAVRLFAVMRAMDAQPDVDCIVAEALPETGLGCAMMDRLRRASAARSVPVSSLFSKQ